MANLGQGPSPLISQRDETGVPATNFCTASCEAFKYCTTTLSPLCFRMRKRCFANDPRKRILEGSFFLLDQQAEITLHPMFLKKTANSSELAREIEPSIITKSLKDLFREKNKGLSSFEVLPFPLDSKDFFFMIFLSELTLVIRGSEERKDDVQDPRTTKLHKLRNPIK